MRSFDDVSNPYKNGVHPAPVTVREAPLNYLAPNPDYKGKIHLPTRMDGYERAIITGQVRVVLTNRSPL